MINPMKKIHLSPCAHCGGKNVHLIREVVNGQVRWYVQCIECGIRTTSYEEDWKGGIVWNNEARDVMKDAITCAVGVWNERVTDVDEEDDDEDDEEEDDDPYPLMSGIVNDFFNSLRKCGLKLEDDK